MYRARLQPTTAKSTAEAEYVAASDVVSDVLWAKRLLAELGHDQGTATILEDNQTAITWTEDPVTTRRAKHIEVKYHSVRDQVENKEVKFVWIPTEIMLADLLTKDVSRARFKEMRKRLLGPWVIGTLPPGRPTQSASLAEAKRWEFKHFYR